MNFCWHSFFYSVLFLLWSCTLGIACRLQIVGARSPQSQLDFVFVGWWLLRVRRLCCLQLFLLRDVVARACNMLHTALLLLTKIEGWPMGLLLVKLWGCTVNWMFSGIFWHLTIQICIWEKCEYYKCYVYDKLGFCTLGCLTKKSFRCFRFLELPSKYFV